MSNDHGKGGNAPPSDDRTILDPLNAEELRALREARERFQKQSAPRGVGPDTGEDIGDAPTRAMSALPSFDNSGMTLEKIAPPSGGGPAPQQSPRIIPDPKPMTPQSARIAAPLPSGPGSHPQPTGAPQAGQPGFGENTLMWMAPVKVEEPKIIPERGQAAGAGMIPTTVPQETKGRRALMVGIGITGAMVIAAMLIFFFTGGSKPGVIELVTNPGKAAVKIDNKPIDVATPMKASLQPGSHVIEIALDGYRSESFTVDVKDGQKPSRRTIDLHPISKPGLMTVSVEVQPVAANITIDGQIHTAKKTVKLANLDPKGAHKVVIEAGGYAKIELDIPANQLKETYNFVLQPDKEATN